MLADVVVALDKVLVGVLFKRRSVEGQLAPRTVWQRNMLQDVCSDRAESSGGNLIVLERGSRDGVDELSARQKVGKVTSAFRHGGHKLHLAVVRGAGARALVRAEIEKLVLQDRTTDAAAELVLLQWIGRCGEIVGGIQCIVAYILKCASVNVVSAGFTDHVHDATRRITVSGAHVVGVEIELLHRVGIWERQIGVNIGVVEIHAIQQIRYAVRSAPIHLCILLAGKCSAFAVGAAILRSYIGRTGNEEDQLLHLATVQRNRDDALLIDELPNSGGICGHQRCIGSHRNLFGDRTYM